MNDNVNIILSSIVEESLYDHEIKSLIERIRSYADVGFVEPNENNEIYVDSNLISYIYRGSLAIRDAGETYGFDKDGYLNYPWEVDSN